MENIVRLRMIPKELLEADNVAEVVLNGFALDKKMMIKKAKIDAFQILQYKELLSPEALRELEHIINL